MTDLFSDELDTWLRSDDPKTLGNLNDVFDERSFAVAIALLMFPSALPIPTGGVTHVLELATMLLALQLVIGREEIWVPRRWQARELGSTLTGKALPFAIRRIRTFERWSHPRGEALFGRGWFGRALGVVTAVFTAASFLAPPFSGLDTLPALGIVLVALSMISRDIVFTLAGLVVGTGGVVLIVTIGRAAAELFTRVL